MAIIQVSKIQQRSGNIVDLPQLDEAEFGWATDVKKLYIGKTTPNENIEVLTSYSNISFSQIDGSYGNLNIDSASLANGQVLTYTGTEWTNRGGNIGGIIDLGDVSNVKIEGGAISYVLETDGTGNLSWAPKTTIVAFIENATTANPGVITTTANNYFVNGSLITITNVPGMTQLNGNSYYAKVLTANTFSLYSDSSLTTTVNTSAYSTFPYTTVTATASGTNQITVGSSSAFTINDPVVFTGTTFGGIVAGTTYYVLTKPTGTTITISETLGGAVFGLTSATGSAHVYATGGRIVSLVSGGTGSGNGVAGGTNTMVQFNNTNVLDGSSDFTFNFGTTPKILTLNGNANVGNLNATSSVIASTLTSNAATGTAPLVVTSTTRVANLNVSNANVADFAGNVTVAAQGNITSLGTLTALNVNARVNATGYTSNVATGTAPLTVTSTTRVANLNVSYANVSDFEVVTTQTSGTYYPVFVSGNTTANYSLASNANIAFNAASGNLITNIVTANGNISGGNISTGGTGNIATLIVPTLANITSTTTSVNTTSGALRVAGGAGIVGNLYIGALTSTANLAVSAIANIATLTVTTAANVTASTQSTTTSTGAFIVTGGVGIGANLFVGGNINGNITTLTTGANTTAGSITGNWTLTSGSRLNATYADLAEYYSADAHYLPGTVLEFGGVNEVTLAMHNTASVAGVVSTDPAYAMNANCTGYYPVPVALQGRVPTKVTGYIKKGDMMISAGNGYATACSSPSMGTVIGKSLENFNGIDGVIEIAIGRL